MKGLSVDVAGHRALKAHLIVGGTTGFGRATAQSLMLERDVDVQIVGRSPERLANAHAELSPGGRLYRRKLPVGEFAIN